MSPSSSGFIRGVFWALLLSSFGWTTCVGFVIGNAVGEEAKCRLAEDKEVRTSLQNSVYNQQATNEHTTKILERILTKLEYIETAVAAESKVRGN